MYLDSQLSLQYVVNIHWTSTYTGYKHIFNFPPTIPHRTRERKIGEFTKMADRGCVYIVNIPCRQYCTIIGHFLGHVYLRRLYTNEHLCKYKYLDVAVLTNTHIVAHKTLQTEVHDNQ